jgi:hypothetical protein
MKGLKIAMDVEKHQEIYNSQNHGDRFIFPWHSQDGFGSQ